MKTKDSQLITADRKTQAYSPIVADEEIAKIIKMSVHWVRKDRITDRVLPFFRLGRAIRYNVPVVIAAFNAHMEGGAK